MPDFYLRIRNGGPYEYIGLAAFGAGAFVLTGFAGAERFPDRESALQFANEKNVRNAELVTVSAEEIRRAE